ncbi:unnamed protein product [Rangifer tarandus platyrhynchus]|uniref:Uncharacterized protein n=1 Tax=Rangifer tarandus platyrhynchus TaxID=3082113 RepID=A0ABN8XKZ4_RANTA|nr:unnamed protein product [Rangifer tarandus platyrhynchus]
MLLPAAVVTEPASSLQCTDSPPWELYVLGDVFGTRKQIGVKPLKSLKRRSARSCGVVVPIRNLAAKTRLSQVWRNDIPDADVDETPPYDARY